MQSKELNGLKAYVKHLLLKLPFTKFMRIFIEMLMKACFHSHFYANFNASITLLFLFTFS